MATMQHSYDVEYFNVIHPLNDTPEEKCTSESLGPIAMTNSVRISLFVLRGYLILMTLMLVYRTLELAGIIHKL